MMDDIPATAARTARGEGSYNRNILAAARGGGIVFFGRVFDYASRFAFGVIVARALGADAFGLYSLGIAISIMLASVARLGLSEGMVHFLPAARSQHDDSRVRGTLQVGLALPLILGIGLALVLFALAEPLSSGLLDDPSAADVLRLVSVCIPVIAVGRLLMACTRGFRCMRYEVYADSIAFGIVRLALTALLLALGYGLLGALAAFVVAWTVSDLLMLFFLNRLYSLRRLLGPATRETRRLLAFSAPICLTQVITQVGANVELLILSVVNTMEAVGVYSAAVRIQMIGTMLLTTAESVAKPIISELYHQGDWAQLERLYRTLTRWSLAFILPYFLTILLFADPILSIFGEEFEQGALILVVVSLGTLVNAGTGICGAMIVMTGHSKMTFVNSLISAGLSVALSLALVTAWGLVGVAVAAALSTALINVIRLVQVFRVHRLWPYSRQFYKPFLAGVVALLVSAAVSHVVSAEQGYILLLMNVVVLWSVYLAMLWLLRLSDEDRMVLLRVQRRLGAALDRHRVA
jgi:O-antigen/teichoic acid export membrane protein